MSSKPRHPIESIIEHFLTAPIAEAERDLATVQAALRARSKVVARRAVRSTTGTTAAATTLTGEQPPAGNAMTLAEAVNATPPPAAAAGRSRGRPAGSRNKRVRDRRAEQLRGMERRKATEAAKAASNKAAAGTGGNGNGEATVAGTTSAPEVAPAARPPLPDANSQATDEPDPAAE